MSAKLILKDGKIMFVEAYPEHIGHSTNDYIEACERALSGALEVKGARLLESTNGAKMLVIGDKDVYLGKGDSFDLPGNVEPEIIEQWKSISGEWISRVPMVTVLTPATRKIVRLHLKEQEPVDSVQWQNIMTTAAGIEPIEEAHGESQCDEDDLRRITIAANVITFLTKYIHGLSSGRKRDSIDIALINAGDQFKNLTRKQP